MTSSTSAVPPKKRPYPDDFQAASAPDAKKPKPSNDLRLILNKVDDQSAILRKKSESADEMMQEFFSRTISFGEAKTNSEAPIFGGSGSAFASPVMPVESPPNVPLNGRVESHLAQITQKQTTTNTLLENLLARGHQPQDPFEAGKNSFEQENYPQAIVFLSNVFQRHPEFGRAKYLLGQCYLKAGNPSEAMEHFSLVPASCISFYQEAQYELGRYYYKQMEWSKAAHHLKNVSTLHPKFDDVQKSLGFCHFNLGASYWEKKDFTVANAYYVLVPPSHELFKLARKYIGLNHFAIGDYFYQRQNYSEALRHYGQVPDGNPAFEDAQYKIGKHYYGIKDFAGAIEPLRKVSQQNNRLFSDAQFSLGGCSWRVKNFRDALKYYLNVSPLDPKFRSAQRNIGLCYYHLNKFPEAIKHLISLQQSGLGSDIANRCLNLCYYELYNAGKRFAKQGHYCKALDCLNQLPQDYYPEAVEHKRGLCFYQIGNFDEAITHLKKGLRNAEIEALIQKSYAALLNNNGNE